MTRSSFSTLVTASLLLAGAGLLAQRPAPMATLEGARGSGFGEALAITDLDGDGRAELLIGAPKHEHAGRHLAGKLCLVPGGALKDLEVRGSAVGGEANRRLGAGIQIADGDGDGKPEIWVGTPGFAQAKGRIFALSPSALTDELDLARFRVTGSLEGEREREGVGRRFLIRDLDGDGKAELIVAAPGASARANPECGEVRVYSRKKGGAPWTLRARIRGDEREGLGQVLNATPGRASAAPLLVVGSPFLRNAGHARSGALALVDAAALMQASKGAKGAPDLDLSDRGMAASNRVLGNAGERAAESLAVFETQGATWILIGTPKHGQGRSKSDLGGFVLLPLASLPKKLDLGAPKTWPEGAKRVSGLASGEQMGAAVHVTTALGGPGVDLIVASPAARRVVAWVDCELSELDRARPTYAFSGANAARGFGTTLATGDLDGDGQAELVIGSPLASRVDIYRLSK